MNYYEQEMRKLFQGRKLFQNPQFTGKTMLARLDDDLRVKIQFINTSITNQYDAVLAVVINRTDGVVDKQTFKFSDILGMVQRPGYGPIAPHIWDNGEKSCWYTPVNDLGKAAIAETITNYLSLFQAKELEVPTQDQTPLYLHSGSYAKEHQELEIFRASQRACLACKSCIESAIADHYRDNRLDTAAVKEVLESFRPEQVAYVLAVTIRHKEWDGRFSQENKSWAKTVPVSYEAGELNDSTLKFVLDRNHPGLVDLFTTQARDSIKENFNMRQDFLDRRQVEHIRQLYPPDTRIQLQHMEDPYAPVPAGTRGTVRYVDDIGGIGVAWDNGRSLSLIPGVDSYRKLTQQELAQEQGEKPSIHDSLSKQAGRQAAHESKTKTKKVQER